MHDIEEKGPAIWSGPFSIKKTEVIIYETCISKTWRKYLEQGEPFHRLDRCGFIGNRRKEAADVGRTLLEQGYDFDLLLYLLFKRAIHTLDHILEEMDRCWLPVVKTWKLNERHYGALQGLNKSETALKYGRIR